MSVILHALPNGMAFRIGRSMTSTWTACKRTIGLAAFVLTSVGSPLGCGAHSTTQRAARSPASAEDAADDVAMGLVEHHRYHHHGGLTLFVLMSLDTLSVSPAEQTAVSGIRNELVASLSPARLAEQALMTQLADGVAAGSLDGQKVERAVTDVTSAARAIHEASGDVLNRLHAALSPQERTALVDKVDAHWGVWQRANAEETGSAPDERSHLAALAAELHLTEDQLDRIRIALRDGMKAVAPLDPKEVDTELRAFGDAFRSATFDVRALTTASDADAHMVGWAVAHLARFVEAASGVLTTEQRAAFAERLRGHAAHDPSTETSP